MAGHLVPFDAFWILVAALLVTSARILSLLRTRHRAVWEELGRPTLVPTAGFAGPIALTRFYWSPRIEAMGDATLSRWVTALRVLQLMLAAVLVVLGLAIFGPGAL